MKYNDPTGAKYDAEVEAIEQLQYQRHLDGECEGAPRCGHCLDEENETTCGHKGKTRLALER